MEDGKNKAPTDGAAAENAPQREKSGISGEETASKDKKEVKKQEKRQKKEEKEQKKAAQKILVRGQKVAEKAAERVAASHAAKAMAEKEAAKALRESLRETLRQQEKRNEQAEAENRREISMYDRFRAYSFLELEQLLRAAESREEKAFYRSLLNLKLQIEQEKVIGEVLL